jgi:hypothetical protein
MLGEYHLIDHYRFFAHPARIILQRDQTILLRYWQRSEMNYKRNNWKKWSAIASLETTGTKTS